MRHRSAVATTLHRLGWIRRLLAFLSSAGAGAAVVYSGLPVDLAGVLGGLAAQAVGDLVSKGQSRESVVDDEANRASRAHAYERFGEAVAGAWHSAGFLLQFRPKIQGYLHGLLALMRTQRRFEEHVQDLVAALADVFLYGSTETIGAAVNVCNALVGAFSQTAACRQGSSEMADLVSRLSLDLGDQVVRWRTSAQADLGRS